MTENPTVGGAPAAPAPHCPTADAPIEAPAASTPEAPLSGRSWPQRLRPPRPRTLLLRLRPAPGSPAWPPRAD